METRAEKRTKGKKRKEKKRKKIFQSGIWSVRKNNNEHQNLFFSYFNQPVTDLRWSTRKWGYKRKFLKLDWSDFHLSSLGGVVMSFPVIPVDAIGSWWVSTMMIQTVQVGVMTALVPPGSFVGHSTVSAAVAVIILIFGAEGITTMPRKRITSSSWKKSKNI